MVKIYLGPAGVPLSTEKPGTDNGIRKVRELGLNAMEVEFVRGVRMNRETAKRIREVAEESRVRLSAHAPYFINLCAMEEDKRKSSIEMIFDTADRLDLMGGDAIAIHAASYMKRSPMECFQLVKEGLLTVMDRVKEGGIKVKLGIETMAKKTAFGTIDEVIRISKEVPNVIPYIDWAHTFGRQKGKIDYKEIIDRLEGELNIPHINSHFESLTLRKGEYVDIHRPIADNAPPFEPLAQEIMRHPNLSISLICESPLLERDALVMKEVLEKLGYTLD